MKGLKKMKITDKELLALDIKTLIKTYPGEYADFKIWRRYMELPEIPFCDYLATCTDIFEVVD